MNWTKVISGVFLALFLGLAGWAGVFFLEMHRELKAARSLEAENKIKLAEAQAKLDAQQKYLDQLQHDPALVEKIIRQKLKFAREEEFVFRFEDTQERK